MEIAPETYLALVPRELRKNFEIGMAVNRLQRYFCTRMALLGKCTTLCPDCSLHLCKIFELANEIQNPRDRGAVLTWMIRDEMGRIADQTETVTAVTARNWMGDRIEESPFELALEEL